MSVPLDDLDCWVNIRPPTPKAGAPLGLGLSLHFKQTTPLGILIQATRGPHFEKHGS